ncbi:bifunctional 2-polyprenyl-6-hydroxyphenol methylase/3-demethylubiquinol 3-O-methyltransferase UbiG [Streptomyces sp. JJ36]|uniref:class I SAM-dependent methyltransferase n=1 Tax=Streptomyces sp. JJ36 TaxID=2736645 RepID=UPI001F2B7EEA|nr:class I SAM-dependent methyltransferase [Streptomyces sp. JJ36]MCF6523087.1 class I SAM-dependent methyltransferase [Streptomyces sp. JJ36]
MAEGYWNHNVHYHSLVLDAVPERCGAALDVGCGDGLLARRLAQRAEAVVGVDVDAEMIRLARERSARVDNVTFAEADLLDDGHGLLADGKYGFVSAVAVVHHVGLAEALAAMRRLLAPGGRMVVVGLARNRTLLDWVVSGAGVPAARVLARRHGGTDHPPGMRVVMPETSWGAVRRDARRLLPGCRVRRHLLWRWSLVWEKPHDAAAP